MPGIADLSKKLTSLFSSSVLDWLWGFGGVGPERKVKGILLKRLVLAYRTSPGQPIH